MCILLYSMIPFIEWFSCYISCICNVLRAPYKSRFIYALCPDWDVRKYIFAKSPSFFGQLKRWVRKVIYSNMNMSINERLSLQWPKQQKKKKRKKTVWRENESSWCTSAVPLFQKRLCELCNKSYPMVQCIHS